MARERLIIAILCVCLAVSLFFDGFLAWRLQNLTVESSRAFTFLWRPEEQDIVDGWLQMNASFVWDENDLYVVVKINYTILRGSYLGLVFDRNKNGKIDYQSRDDLPYILFMDNTTYTDPPHPELMGGNYTLAYTSLLLDGRLGMLLMSSSYVGSHTCIFDPETGYTFAVKFPGLMRRLNNKLAHVVFEDVERMYEVEKNFVVKRFSFG